MELKAGKKYNHRGGVEEIISIDGIGRVYPIIGDNERYYTSYGQRNAFSRDDPLDLISEYVAPEADSDFDIVNPADITTGREKLNKRFGIGEGRMAADPATCPTCKNGARISPCPECSDPKPAVEYGPWIIWNGREWTGCIHNVEAIWLLAKGGTTIEHYDTLVEAQMSHADYPKVIAYRVAIEPEAVVWRGYWDKELEDFIHEEADHQDDDQRNVRITIKGDDITAEWVDD